MCLFCTLSPPPSFPLFPPAQFPAGFISERVHTSLADPTRTCVYRCSILDPRQQRLAGADYNVPSNASADREVDRSDDGAGVAAAGTDAAAAGADASANLIDSASGKAPTSASPAAASASPAAAASAAAAAAANRPVFHVECADCPELPPFVGASASAAWTSVQDAIR